MGRDTRPRGRRRDDVDVDADGREFARGLSNYGREEVERIKGLRSQEIPAVLGLKPYDEVVHRDNLLVLQGPDAPTGGL